MTVNATMTVIQPGNGAPPVADRLAAKRAQVEALKAQGFKLSAEEADYAKLCAEENAEHERHERERAESLAQRAQIVEADCRSKLGPKADTTQILCMYDRGVEKACGYGIVVVRALEGEHAVKALEGSNRLAVNEKGLQGFDTFAAKSQAEVMEGLLKHALYPDAEGITAIVTHGWGLAYNAYRAAAQMTGAQATTLAGKSAS